MITPSQTACAKAALSSSADRKERMTLLQLLLEEEQALKEKATAALGSANARVQSLSEEVSCLQAQLQKTLEAPISGFPPGSCPEDGAAGVPESGVPGPTPGSPDGSQFCVLAVSAAAADTTIRVGVAAATAAVPFGPTSPRCDLAEGMRSEVALVLGAPDGGPTGDVTAVAGAGTWEVDADTEPVAAPVLDVAADTALARRLQEDLDRLQRRMNSRDAELQALQAQVRPLESQL